MARVIAIHPERTLEQHAAHANLAPAVEELRRDALPVARALRGRTLWMVNSTVQGGGVSEMLPGMVAHLRELGLAVEWAVIEAEDEHFFQVTKRIHNLIHGDGAGALGRAERVLYEGVNRANAEALGHHLRTGDILVVHDPQPMPLASLLAEQFELTTVWRCHIGLDAHNRATETAWSFLEPYAAVYDHAVFSAPEYVPHFFEGRSTIIYPSIDPLTEKNRPLRVQAVIDVLVSAGLVREPGPRVGHTLPHVVRRLQPDGTWLPAAHPDDLGLLTRPIVTQVSRWDRLKGFLPLLRGFIRMKRALRDSPPEDAQERRALELARLVLAGPDPDAIADDPEGREVVYELSGEFMSCEDDVRADIALLALPMEDLDANALIVNALQRVSTVVAQNSLREGFGLTITEAMWKAVPVLSNSRACGPRQQIRDRVEGRLIRDPEDPAEIAGALRELLTGGAAVEEYGRAAQRRVHEHFLIYDQLRHWLRLLAAVTGAARAA